MENVQSTRISRMAAKMAGMTKAEIIDQAIAIMQYCEKLEAKAEKKGEKPFKTERDLEFVPVQEAMSSMRIKRSQTTAYFIMQNAYDSCKDDTKMLIRRDAAYAVAAKFNLIKV